MYIYLYCIGQNTLDTFFFFFFNIEIVSSEAIAQNLPKLHFQPLKKNRKMDNEEIFLEGVTNTFKFTLNFIQ